MRSGFKRGLLLALLWACTDVFASSAVQLSLLEANKLVELPLHCVEQQYPNKLNQTIGSDTDLLSPRTLHPTFYGCFDWHSAVHGYWSMVTLLRQFPTLDKADQIRAILQRNINAKNLQQELAYFEKDINKSFERTYGWAWLLKLAAEVQQWDDPLARELQAILSPLSNHIANKYITFLPKLVYPIRVGEHTNTAFGLAFAHDYAKAFAHHQLTELIEARAKAFYLNDENCPISWEPSGYDFLSPCLEEVDIMRRVLPDNAFLGWLAKFMPQLIPQPGQADFQLEVGLVGDRSDGKLVHLDGANFSRAWVLYGLSRNYPQLKDLQRVADQHVAYSYPNLIGDDYEGGHWLASFAILALNSRAK